MTDKQNTSVKNPLEEIVKPIPALGPLQRPKNKRLKLYNFRNPDKFSKDHLRVLSSIHDVFCRQANITLNAALRMTTDISVANVQQLTYADYIGSMPEDLLVLNLSMYPFNTQFCLGIERHLVGAVIDRTLGGTGMSTVKEEMTDVEVGIVKDMFTKLLAHLPEGWQNLIPTDEVELESVEQGPQAAQIVSPTDIIALVTINIAIGSYLGFMNVCIPYAALEDVISRLTRDSTYKHENVADLDKSKELILSRLSATSLSVKTVLAKGDLMLSEIMNLEVDDVIKLSTATQDEAEVWVGEKLKFFGSPGKSAKKLSVAITRVHEDR